jgi:spermidine/putrescine-binding protein
LADCGISILDSPTDIFPMMLRYLGKDGDTTNVEDYQAVVDAFKPVRQYIRTFDNTNYLNAIPNKELCVINNWSGDYSTAKSRAAEAGIDINLEYHVPETGAPAWVDALCMPADAAHAGAAYKFLDYMLEPEVIAKCTNFTNYANGNLASKPFVDKAVLDKIEVLDSEIAAQIREQMFTFDDIQKLDKKSIQKILSSVDSRQLAVSLKAATPTVEQVILGNLSKRAAETVREERDNLGPMPLSEVLAAQGEILKSIRAMIDKGEIKSGSSNEQMV